MAYGPNYVGMAGSLTNNQSGVDLIPQVAEGLVSPENASPGIVTLLAQIPGSIETVYNYVYQWNEIQHDEPDITCNTAIAATAASTDITDKTVASLAVGVGDLFHEPVTGTNLEIISVDTQDPGAGTSVVDFRAVPYDEAIPAISAGAMLIRMGTNFPEGQWLPNAKTKKPVRVSNKIMQFGDQIEVSNLQLNMANYYGSEWELQKKNAISRVQSGMESRVWFSKEFEESRTMAVTLGTGTDYVRGSGGIIERTTSYTPYTGTIDEATLDDWCVNVVWGGRYPGSDEKFVFAGDNFLYGITQFVKNRYQKLDSVPEYGFAITRYNAPVGNHSLYLIQEKQFKTTAYTNTAYALDLDYIRVTKVGQTLINVYPTTQPGKTSKAIGFEGYMGVKQMLAGLVHHGIGH